MLSAGFLLLAGAAVLLRHAGFSAEVPIQFALKSVPFRLENSLSPARNAPESMAGGVAVFDYNQDGRPDLFFTNGANIATLKKDDPKYKNRLFRNDGNGVFVDVTEAAGLAGTGFDIGAAVADYDGDGWPDLFVAGVHHNTLYHNNGNGTFSDVSVKAGLNRPDAEYGPIWSVAAAWVDANNDGRLDLFVVNYLQWKYSRTPMCLYKDQADFCHPRFYKGLPNQLLLNNGDGTFRDVSAESGIRSQVGKGMGVGVADYDLDGKPDLFVPNDGYYNFFFHNLGGSKFEEAALPNNVALAEDGGFISGMGLDFRDINNDGYPDIAYVALNNQTFPLLLNAGGKEFRDITTESGMHALTSRMAGFGAGLYDLDNDGWKDLFVSRGHVASLAQPGTELDQPNTVFRNPGASGKWQALTEEAGLGASAPAKHRGLAFGDLDGDGRIDVVTTALGREPEIWMNRSGGAHHWLEIALEGTKSNRDGIGARVKVVTKSGAQYNHMTSSVGYASSSYGPVHFGLGADAKADSVEICWPSGIVQTLKDVSGDRVLKVKESAAN